MTEIKIRLQIADRLKSRKALALLDSQYFIDVLYKDHTFRLRSKADNYILGVYKWEDIETAVNDFLAIFENVKGMAHLDGFALPQYCRGDKVHMKSGCRILTGIIKECHSDGTYRVRFDLGRGVIEETTTTGEAFIND